MRPVRSRTIIASGCAERLIPASADTTQERGIDNQFAERVDQGDVNRREAPDARHIDTEIEAIGIRRFDEGAQRPGMGVRVISSRSCSFSKRYTTRKSPSRVPANTMDFERSSAVGRVEKLSARLPLARHPN